MKIRNKIEKAILMYIFILTLPFIMLYKLSTKTLTVTRNSNIKFNVKQMLSIIILIFTSIIILTLSYAAIMVIFNFIINFDVNQVISFLILELLLLSLIGLLTIITLKTINYYKRNKPIYATPLSTLYGEK